jgi:hypothetical protein
VAYADAITALADPTRRAVLEQLRAGPRADGDGLAELRAYVNGFWDEALASYEAAANTETEGDDDGADRG